MKSFFISFVLLLISFSSFSQTQVFKTEEDYKAGKFDAYGDDYANWTQGAIGWTVIFHDLSGEKVKIHTKDIWGYTFRGRFFRTVGKEIAMLKDTGAINFWINGYAGMAIVYNEKGYGTVRDGATECFLSIGGNTAELYRMPINDLQKRDYKDFKKAYPDLDIYDCFKDANWSRIGTAYAQFSTCVRKYNDKHKNSGK